MKAEAVLMSIRLLSLSYLRSTVTGSKVTSRARAAASSVFLSVYILTGLCFSLDFTHICTLEALLLHKVTLCNVFAPRHCADAAQRGSYLLNRELVRAHRAAEFSWRTLRWPLERWRSSCKLAPGCLRAAVIYGRRGGESMKMSE